MCVHEFVRPDVRPEGNGQGIDGDKLLCPVGRKKAATARHPANYLMRPRLLACESQSEGTNRTCPSSCKRRLAC